MRVICNAEKLTKDYDSRHYVVVAAGVADIQRNETVISHDVKKNISKLSHTNLILLTVPFL